MTAKTQDAAVEQGIQVLTNPRASREQKAAAVTQVGTTVVTDAARRTVKKNAPKVAKAAKEAAKYVVPAAVIAGTLAAGGKALTANREREAKKKTKQALATVEKKLKRKLTPDERSTLEAQHLEYFRKQPTSNSFLGK